MRRLATLLVAAFAIPALASAQAGTRSDTTARHRERGERMEQQDTTHHARRTARTHARTRHMRTSGGEVALNMGLDHSQVQQLQQALRDDGCNPGPVDGILGPRTRQAMACSRQKHDLTGQNANALFRALNLPFTAPDSTGMGGVMRGRGEGGMRDTTDMTGRMRDTTGRMHGNMRGNMHGNMHGNMRGTMHGNMRGRDTTRPDTTH